MGPPLLSEQLAKRADGELRTFYAGRGFQPLWIRPDGRLGDAAQSLLGLVRTSRDDGLKPVAVKARALESALNRAGEDASPKNLINAEMALTPRL